MSDISKTVIDAIAILTPRPGISDDTLNHLARALDSALDDEGEDLTYPGSESEALKAYQTAYDGRVTGLAERREVGLPIWLSNWHLSFQTLEQVARIERARDDFALSFVRAK